jgi:YD repeat-containing protein
MKKNLFTACTIIFTCAMLTNCKKEIKDTQTPISQSEAALSKAENSCRLIQTHSEYGDVSYTYNERGLLDVWNYPAAGGYFKHEYDETGRLIKSRFYSGNILINTIVFSYGGKYVVKETWYAGDTKEKQMSCFIPAISKG